MKRFRLNFAILAFAATVALPSAAGAELPAGDFDKAMDKYLSNEKNVEKIGTAIEALIRKKRDEQEKARNDNEAQEM